MESPNNTSPPLKEPLSLHEVTKLLVKHFGYHEGLWDLSLEFQLAVGSVGPSPDKVLPGAMLAVSRIGLNRAEIIGPATVDASKVDPA